MYILHSRFAFNSEYFKRFIFTRPWVFTTYILFSKPCERLYRITCIYSLAHLCLSKGLHILYKTHDKLLWRRRRDFRIYQTGSGNGYVDGLSLAGIISRLNRFRPLHSLKHFSLLLPSCKPCVLIAFHVFASTEYCKTNERCTEYILYCKTNQHWTCTLYLRSRTHWTWVVH